MNDKTKKIITIIVVAVIIIGGLYLIFNKDELAKTPTEKQIVELLKNDNLTEDQRTILNEAKEKLKESPEDVTAIVDIARIKYQLEDYDGAKELYHKALEINPDSILVYQNLGNIYLIEKNYQKAEEMYLTIIEKTPKWVNAYRELEKIYRFHIPEKHPGIEQIFLDGIEKGSDINEYAPVDLYIMLGTFYQRNDQAQKAIEYYETALEIMPENKVVQRELEKLK